MRQRRSDQRGAETLEFLGLLPLVVMVALLAAQAVVLAHEQAQAATDARTLVRQAVICGSRPLALTAIDAAAKGGAVSIVSSPGGQRGEVTATVSLPPQTLLPGVNLGAIGIPSPRAAVTMLHEPC